MICDWNYSELKATFSDRRKPLMVVNLDCLDYNISIISDAAEKFDKDVRIATKSIRVPALIKYIQRRGGGKFSKVMCYSVEEANFLATEGIDDLLIAYPAVHHEDISVFHKLSTQGKKVTMMVDSRQHLNLIDNYWQEKESQIPARVCIDIDMSYRPSGIHMGVHRSPVRSLDQFIELLDFAISLKNIEIAGLMGYEAQIAGMGEINPFSRYLNPVKNMIKKKSLIDVRRKREEVHKYLDSRAIKVEFFNGGGTGSLESTMKESCITECAVGSGFLQSHLFDYYRTNRCVPAFCFALEVTRKPQKNMVTCKSGGFIASGEISGDKAPLPFMPAGLKSMANEGFGEVQTPLQVPSGQNFELGDPIFFRPAKSGEIAERFNEYYLVRDNKIREIVKTYRGLGYSFY